MRRCSYAISALFVFFFNIAFDTFLKIVKDKVMHRYDLFFQKELNIKNVLPLFKRVSLFYNHDSWH